jgi:hypothetical protein
MSKSKGRKGGASFPRYDLKQLSKNFELVASKTSKKAMNEDDFCRGVLGISSGQACGYRVAALRHFGLLEKDQYKTTELCSEIAARPKTERSSYLVKAFMSCSVFKKTYNTCSGRVVKTSEIETYANRSLGVHLENTEEFAKIFMTSAIFAGLGTATTGGISLIKVDGVSKQTESSQISDAENAQDTPVEEVKPQPQESRQLDSDESKSAVQIKLDSTMDPEKLEKLLKILQKYDLI